MFSMYPVSSKKVPQSSTHRVVRTPDEELLLSLLQEARKSSRIRKTRHVLLTVLGATVVSMALFGLHWWLGLPWTLKTSLGWVGVSLLSGGLSYFVQQLR